MAGTYGERRKVTNARKLGWEDPDRSSPQHDAIVHWLEEQREQLITQWFDDPRSRGREWWRRSELAVAAERIARAREEALSLLETAAHAATPHGSDAIDAARERLRAWGGLPLPPDIGGQVGDIIGSEWERPIMHASGNSVVGFVDYCVSYRDEPDVEARNAGAQDALPRSLHGSLYGGGPSAWDVIHAVERMFDPDHSTYALPAWRIRPRERHLCIEVKVEIAQVSEVLRQLQFYKVYEAGPWAVATPDWRHAKTLLEQGIGFIPYTPGAEPKVYRPGSTLDVDQWLAGGVESTF
jgi:hypothetical protein